MIPTDLRDLFDIVQKKPWSSARHIGKEFPGGKTRANHYLYGYQGILFVRRGLTPPVWKVMSDDAYAVMVARVKEPQSPPAHQTPKKSVVTRRSRTPLAWTRPPAPVIARRDLAPISICQSCDLPIQSTGRCGCS